MYYIAHNIKFLREKHKLSINDIAEKTSIPKSTIASYAEGRAKNPSEENVKKLAILFDVDPSDLLHKNIARFPVPNNIPQKNSNGVEKSTGKYLSLDHTLTLKGGAVSMATMLAMSVADLMQLQRLQDDTETIKAIQEIISYKQECEYLKRENELLQARICDKDQTISAKDETIRAYQQTRK